MKQSRKTEPGYEKDTGDHYPTLNQLNASIAAGAENIWNSTWKYRAEDGKICSINDLRR